MSVTYAEKFSPKVDERFKLKSLSKAFTNQDYDFVDVDTVKIYSIPTVPMADYKLDGANRYGDPSELQNEVQTMILTEDRCFTYTVDKKSQDDTVGVMRDIGKSLARQQDEVITPEIDTYVFAKMVTAAVANDSYATAAVTSENAYEKLLDGLEKLGDALVPESGRVCGVSYNYYKYLKLDDSFNLASEIAMNKRINGQVGDVEGMPIVKIPKSLLPANVSFIIAHPVATVAPMKLKEFKIFTKPQGLSGALVEGRVRYGCFVLNNKVDAIYVHGTAVIS